MKNKEEVERWGVGPVVSCIEAPHSAHQELELDHGIQKKKIFSIFIKKTIFLF